MHVLKQLFFGLGTALATTGGLFALQFWYSSYLDVMVIHDGQRDLPMDEKLQGLREGEDATLTSGAMPIDRAMKALAARGRSDFPKLAAKPSGDLSAMSGWIHRPGFKPYVPRPAVAPAAEQTPLAGGARAAPEGAGESAPEERHER